MPDPRYELQATFEPSRRYEAYGDALLRMHIKGFRNHVNTILDIESPVTAFCGVNGSGKSTILQLAASAYQASVGTRYYVSTFILAGSLDTRPFRDDASVDFSYAEPAAPDGRVPVRNLTLTRSGGSWAGYDRQPQRAVTFLGSGFYLPHAERDQAFKNLISDGTFTSRSNLRLADTVIERVSGILLCKYDSAHRHSMRKRYARQLTQVIKARRASGLEYSEANMGSGEARLYALVTRVEAAPEKSLVLIEEPETSLHPCAQFELGKYLVETAKRRKLQILVTTHSEYLMLALPQRSRILLKRDDGGVTPIAGVGVRQAISMMDGFAMPSVYIVVEDDVAEAVVAELLRKHDADFLKTVRVLISGDSGQIQRMMSVFEDQKIPVCAVRDADKGENRRLHVFRLFGSRPPEVEIFASASFRERCTKDHGVEWDAADIANKKLDHHRWFDILCTQTALKRAEILPLAARAYLAGISETERQGLVDQIKASIP